jgi:L-cysteine desulfidase
MNTDNASLYVKWLKQEVAPALGCTEPVAIFRGRLRRTISGSPCTKISGFISANLYKNAMGVTIPGTTVCGVPLAAAIGAFGGDPQKGLKTLEDITPRHVEMAQKLIANNAVDIAVEETPDFIHLDLTSLLARIAVVSWSKEPTPTWSNFILMASRSH